MPWNFGIGNMNENGQRLLETCSFNDLYVTNTFLKNKPQVSWRHPRSKQWHQLDMIITRRRALHHVKNTRTYHSADCNSDHSPVVSNIKLIWKKIYRTKQTVKPQIIVSYTVFYTKTEESVKLITEECLKNSFARQKHKCHRELELPEGSPQSQHMERRKETLTGTKETSPKWNQP